MEDDPNVRRPKFNTTKMEDDKKWKTTKMEDNLNGRRPTLNTSKIEDDQNGRQRK